MNYNPQNQPSQSEQGPAPNAFYSPDAFSSSYAAPQTPEQQKKKKVPTWIAVLIILITLSACVACGVITTNTGHGTPRTSASSTPKTTPQAAPQYPPKTLNDLRGLAAKGDESAIHEFHSESTGATGACPQPEREVTVSQNLTGQQLAEDLLAYFYAQQLDSPCGSLVLAYHSPAEAGNGYTAGRVDFTVTDSSGNTNVDPNGTNLKYSLTLDIGNLASGQEYTVTY
jgi:hypothetical protein